MTKHVVVAGCRDYENYGEAKEFIDYCLKNFLAADDTVIIVSGCCRGSDLLGERYASEHGMKIEKFPAKWSLFGKSAGPIRNNEMAQVGDLFICFWDSKSRGTMSMIEFAKQTGKIVAVKRV